MAALSSNQTWSTTAASNNAAVPEGWPEGMAPSGVNDTGRSNMAAVRTFFEDIEWREWGHTIAFNSTTKFDTAAGDGDTTAIYLVGRRVKAVGATTGTIYGFITASAHSSVTTVTVSWDSGTLQNEALTVSVGSSPTGGAFWGYVTTTLQPDSDGGQDLGTTSVRWANLYVDNIGDTGQTLTFTGSVNFDSDTFFVDSSNNRVGVGTASPQNSLHVSDAQDTQVRIDSSHAYTSSEVGGTILLRQTATPGGDNSIPWRLLFQAADDGGGNDNVGIISVVQTDISAGTEDSYFELQTKVAGATAARVVIGAGLYTASNTDSGADTINATRYFAGGTGGVASGSFVAGGQTVTVTGGLITNIAN